MIIGAPKCGTTWLTKRLRTHPEITIPEEEVHFFTREWERGWPWYEQELGPLHGTVLGENSNSYLTEDGALERVRDNLPDVRLIAILRNPIERAYSSYGMQVDRGRADGDIELYLDPQRSPRPHILTNGLYARMLEPWLAVFPRNRFLLLAFDDIATRPRELFARTLEFLNVDSTFAPEGLTMRENARKSAGIPGPVKRALWWARPMFDRGFLKPLRDGPLIRAAERVLSRDKRYAPLTPALVERLSAYYEDDMRQLEATTGFDAQVWRDANWRKVSARSQ